MVFGTTVSGRPGRAARRRVHGRHVHQHPAHPGADRRAPRRACGLAARPPDAAVASPGASTSSRWPSSRRWSELPRRARRCSTAWWSSRTTPSTATLARPGRASSIRDVDSWTPTNYPLSLRAAPRRPPRLRPRLRPGALRRRHRRARWPTGSARAADGDRRQDRTGRLRDLPLRRPPRNAGAILRGLGTAAARRAPAAGRCSTLFEEQAARTPDAPAVTCAGTALSLRASWTRGPTGWPGCWPTPAPARSASWRSPCRAPPTWSWRCWRCSRPAPPTCRSTRSYPAERHRATCSPTPARPCWSPPAPTGRTARGRRRPAAAGRPRGPRRPGRGAPATDPAAGPPARCRTTPPTSSTPRARPAGPRAWWSRTRNVVRLFAAHRPTGSASARTTCGRCSTPTPSTSRSGRSGARCCTAAGWSSCPHEVSRSPEDVPAAAGATSGSPCSTRRRRPSAS